MPSPALYRRIKNTLMTRIRAGEWRPGQTIPGEETLALEFGCARATVHRALRELAEAGVLDRRRRKGTTVALPPARLATFEVPRVEEEVRALGAAYDYRLLERRLLAVDAAAREQMQLPRGTRAIRLLCLHRANGAPWQLERRWINLQAVPAARDADFHELPPGSWLLEHVPWTDVEHVLSAENAEGSTAALLELEAGDALFVVERRTWLERQVITWARFAHPGRHFRLHTARRG